MIIYGVHFGSIYEGGGAGDFYKTKDGAIKEALMLLNEKQSEHEEMYKAENPKHYTQYSWKQINETTWNNSVDEIVVIERKLKD